MSVTKKHIFTLSVALLFALTAILSSCGSKEPAGPAGPFQVIYNLGSGPEDPLNPYIIPNYKYTRFLVNSPLVFFWTDRSGKSSMDYILAESIDISGGYTEFTIKLRANAKWHDGEPVTAHDLVYSKDFWYDDGIPYSMYFGRETLPGVWTEVDAKTVNVKYQEPYNSFLEFLDMSFVVVPSHIFEGKTAEEIVQYKFEDKGGIPVGNGPFKYVSHSPDEYIQLEKFADYYEPAVIDNMRVQLIREDSIAVAAMQTGELDVTTTWDSNTNLLQNDPNINVYMVADGRVLSIWFNLENEHAADVNIRRAISCLVDQDAIVKGPLAGIGIPTKTYMPVSGVGYDPSIETLPYNIEKAKECVEASGYTMGTDGYYEKNGQRLSIHWPNVMGQGSIDDLMGLVIQQEAKKAGIEIVWEQVAYNTWVNARTEATWFAEFNYYMAKPTASAFAVQLADGFNRARYGNQYYGGFLETAEALADKAVKAEQAGDAAGAAEGIKEFQRFLRDNQILIPIYYYVNCYSARNTIDISASALSEFCFINRVKPAAN